MNTLMLYTEETYTVPDEPYFGAYRGRYSQDEIREMDAYARTLASNLYRVSRHWRTCTMP